MFIVICTEHLRDGVEDGGRVTTTLDQALALIQRWADGPAGATSTFRLFEMGREIPLERRVIAEPQPSRHVVRYAVAKE